MKPENLEAVGRLVDKLENLKAGLGIPLPPHMHVQLMGPQLQEIADELKQLYFKEGGEDVWD